MDEIIKLQLEKYPYLKAFLPFTIYISEEELAKYKRDFKIKCDDKEISHTLLKNLIQNPYYYNYVKKLFSDEVKEIWIRSIKGGDLVGNITINKVQLVSGLSKIIEINPNSFNDEEKNRYYNLLNSISFEKFLEKNGDNTFKVSIDGTDYAFKINELISFINLSDIEFNNICSNKDIKEINGIAKEKFVYAIYKYINENSILQKYRLPENILKHYNDIKSNKLLDIEAFNEFMTTVDPHINEVVINQELKDAIMKDMPENLTLLEKSIYIYIKMCKLLTYDEEFLAFNQKGEVAKKHEDINRISTVTPTNNKIVCYEFNSIYGKLLNELGIKYISNQTIGDSYGDSHVNLEFRCDKFLVVADSVTNILHSDLTQGKLNANLLGFICKNHNEETLREFDEAVSTIYQLFKDNEKIKGASFESALSEYQSLQSTIEIPLEEKLDILVTKANRSDLEGVDSLAYILQLQKILFKKDGNFDIKVIRNNETHDENKKAMATAIVIIYDVEESEFKYYIYNPHERLIPILPKALQEKFDSGAYAIIDRKIPGIKHDKGGKSL